MSQVRKLLQGNKISKAQEGYKFNFNNQDIYLTDEELNKLQEDVNGYGLQYSRFVANAPNAIKSGALYGNIADNTGSRELFGNLGEKDIKRLERVEPIAWEALAKTDSYYAKEALGMLLRSIQKIVNSRSDKKSSDKSKTLDSDVIPLDFNTENGITYLSPYGKGKPKKRIDEVLTHLQAGDKSEYDTTGWDFTDIQDWLNNSPDLKGDDKYAAAKAYFENLLNTMGDKTSSYVMSPDVEDLLSLFKISKGGLSSAQAESNPKSESQKEFEKEFGNVDYDLIGSKFSKDKYGIWRLNPGETFDIGIPELRGRNIYFNDDFYTTYGAGRPYLNGLKGLTFYGDALYPLSSKELYEIIHRPGGYDELLSSGDWAGANNEIMTAFSPEQRFVPVSLDSDRYFKPLSENPNLRYGSLNGGYINGNPLEKGHQLLQIVDLSKKNYPEGSPYLTYNFVINEYDENGKPVEDKQNIDRSTITFPKGTSGLMSLPMVTDSNSKAVGMVYEDPTGRNDDISQVRIYWDPNDTGNAIIHVPGGLRAAGIGSDIDLKVPKELATLLVENKETWLPKILNDDRLARRFESLLSDLVRSNFAKSNTGLMARQTFKRLGFSDKLDEILQAWENARKGNRWTRRDDMLVYSPSFEKNGGKIQYISKLAGGGFANANTDSIKKSTKQYTDKKVDKIENPSSLSEIFQGKGNQADTADIVALVADLASLGVTIADPTNIAGALTGAAGSIARFKADKIRNEKGAGRQLAINLAMDAATVLPVAGDFINANKVARGVRKALPTIIKYASAWGLSQSVINTATKIANGEKFTARDLSILANGLTAGMALNRTGGLGKSTVKGKTIKKVSVKSKTAGESPIELSSAELENISSADELIDALHAKAKQKLNNPELTKEEFLQKYNIDEVAPLAKKWNPGWSPKNWIRTKNVREYKQKLEPTRTALSKKTSDFYNWWHGIGNRPQVFKANAVGNDASVLGTTNVPGRIKYRVDVKEAPGTVANGNYYKDEFGTWYRIGNHSSTPATAQEIANAANIARRQAINDANGNFIGQVKVIEGVINPTTSTHYYPRVGVFAPQYFDPFMYNQERTREALPGTEYGLTYRGLHKKGGVLKGQSGIAPFEWKKQEEKNPYLPEQPKFEPIKSQWTKYNDIVGGPTYNIKDRSKWLLPALSLARFGVTSHFQNKYNRQAKEALNAARFSEQPVTLNTPDSNNPTYDRALNQLNSERVIGVKPVTSDLVTNNALSNQREAQLWDRENTLLGQRSQYDHDIKNEILNIQNQNNANYINTTNQNAARTASINSAIKQQDMELTQRRSQSWENLGLEMQKNLYKDRQTMLNYNRTLEAQRLEKEYDRNIDALFPVGARAKYLGLPPAEAAKYYDFEDFLRVNFPDDYQKNIDRLKELEEEKINSMNAWHYNNGLNYSYPEWITGRKSPVGIDRLKKGGRVNGKTRYRLEPDEQIWVDNNKATHAAIAKLSENTIKLLLRALK